MEIKIDAKERDAGRMSAGRLAEAVKAIREDGYVIIAGAVDIAHLEHLRTRMEADSRLLIKDKFWGGAGDVEGHLQQGAPPFAPYVFRDVAANPFAIQLSLAILGPGAFNSFYNGNTSTPGSGTQPLHADAPHLWQGAASAHPTHRLVVNVPLIEMTVENGATELWPGTHNIPIKGQNISKEAEAERRRIVAPVRAVAARGSIVVRDIRLWHRGVPNKTGDIRHLIAMIHNIHWWHNAGPLPFNKGCEAEFPHLKGFNHNVSFTEGKIDYLHTPTPPSYEEMNLAG